MTTEERIILYKRFMPITKSKSPSVETWLYDNGFFTAPARTKFHGSYEGGLFDHSFTVAKALVELTERNDIRWKNPRSPYIIGMYHDICKIDQYKKKEPGAGFSYETPVYEYNTNTFLTGHGDKSVMLLSQFFSLTEEEILCIRYHMGAFTDKEEWKYYTKAVNKYPTVLWTHTADMIASHVLGV